MSRLVYCALISTVLLARATTDAAGYGDTVAVTGTPETRRYVPRSFASRQEAPPMASPTDVTADYVRALIVAEALTNGTVPPELALAVAREESNFNPGALSPAGARGVMQIMPATARREFGVEPDQLWSAPINIRLGVAHLERLYQQYGRSWEPALSHYNGGTLRIGETGEPIPHDFTRAYVAGVKRRWDDYAADPDVARLVAEVSSAIAPTLALASAPDQERSGGPYGQSRTDVPPPQHESKIERVPCDPDAPPASAASAPTSAGAGREPGSRAVTGTPSAGGLLEDIEQARVSFRRALEARSATRW